MKGELLTTENGILSTKCQKWDNTYLPDGSREVVNIIDEISGNRYRKEVEAFRNMNFTDKKASQKFKARTFPALTISGIFKSRHDSQLIEHSGMVAIDLDGITELAELKRKVAALPFVVYCGLSCSGTGLYAVCRIPKCDAEEHKLRYQALETYFIAHIGVEASPDRKCKNVSRLRYVSYDSDGYLNINASVLDLLPEVRPVSRVYSNEYLDLNNDPTERKVHRLINEISKRSLDIADDYNDGYLSLAFSFAGTYGERGRALFHQAVQWSRKYDAIEADKKFDNVLRTAKPESMAAFFALCKRNGLDVKSREGEHHRPLVLSLPAPTMPNTKHDFSSFSNNPPFLTNPQSPNVDTPKWVISESKSIEPSATINSTSDNQPITAEKATNKIHIKREDETFEANTQIPCISESAEFDLLTFQQWAKTLPKTKGTEGIQLKTLVDEAPYDKVLFPRSFVIGRLQSIESWTGEKYRSRPENPRSLHIRQLIELKSILSSK